MRILSSLLRFGFSGSWGRGAKPLRLIGVAALFWGFGAAAAWAAAPVIFNQPFTANPGDVISVTGSSLTTTPKVYLQGSRQSSATQVAAMEATDNVLVIQIPATMAFDMYKLWVVNGNGTSAPVYLNAPRAMQSDAPRAVHYDSTTATWLDNAATPAIEVGSNQYFRLFGYNLCVKGATPSVTLVDTQTGASLPTAMDLNICNPYTVKTKSPAGIIAGRTYKVVVSNGYGTANADQNIVGRTGGYDWFQLGVTWGPDFIYQNGASYQSWRPGVDEQDHHLYNVRTDPVLKVHAAGDGVTDDTAAINTAISLAAKSGGGIVYLPAGTYRLASPSGPQTGISLQAGVALQGHSASDTKIVYGPTGPQPSSYQFRAVTFNGDKSGIADLSFQNTDSTGLNIIPLGNQWNVPYSELFVQRVNWNLNGGPSIVCVACNKIAIENSTFTALANGPNIIGPFYFAPVTNMLFSNNKLSFGFQGSVSFLDVNGLVVEGNHFTRYSSPTWTGLGRQMSVGFLKNGVIQGNIFDVSGGTLPFKNSDGETINNEGGANTPRNDAGSVTSATSTSVTDGSRCATCAWNYYPNSYVVLVSGKGAGQWRHIVQRSGNTFTTDTPWDVTPAAGDHFVIGQPSYENALILNNTMQNNPAGIVLFGPVMFLNVAISGNKMTDNGGIALSPYQVNQARWSTSPPVPYLSAAYRNIDITNNVLTNTKGQWASYINVELFSIYPNQFWGVSVDGVSVRGNQITAHPAINANNYIYTGADGGEGYQTQAMNQQTSGSFNYNGPSSMIGTVYQGNSCTNCPVDYTVTNGALATVIWNASNPSNIASTHLLDEVFGNWSANTPGPHSTGTLTNSR